MNIEKFIEALTEKEELELYGVLKKKMDHNVKVCTVNNFILMTDLHQWTKGLLKRYQGYYLTGLNREDMYLHEVDAKALSQFTPKGFKSVVDFIHQRDIFLTNYF